MTVFHVERSVTFIHAADLHLGAPFKGLSGLSPEWADRLVESIPLTFQRIIDLALQDRVDFVIFAGDTFDDSKPSYGDYVLFANGMKQLDQAGIPVYCCAGNHDPLEQAQRHYGMMPPNVIVFPADRPSFACFKKEGRVAAVIAGRSFQSDAEPGARLVEGVTRDELIRYAKTQEPGLVLQPEPVTVGVLHTGLDIDPTRAPISRDDLLATGLDYWACGHIHVPMLHPFHDTRIAFSGSPQGRASGETGDHGVLEVTLEPGKPNDARFVPLAQVAWAKIVEDVSGCTTLDQVRDKIRSRQFAQNASLAPRDMVFGVRLVGATALHSSLTPAALEDMRAALNDEHPHFFIDAIVDQTIDLENRETLLAPGLFPATFVETVDSARRDAPSREAALASVRQAFNRLGIRPPADLESGLDGYLDEGEDDVLALLARDAAFAGKNGVSHG